MHARLLIPTLAMSLLFAGCASSVESRIARHKAEFDALPSAVQQDVRAGRVEVGQTEAAVLLALGEPSRRVERRDESGVSDVWIYARRGPKFSFGFGVSAGNHHSALGVGIDATLPRRVAPDDEAMRVEFQQGRVVKFEYRKR